MTVNFISDGDAADLIKAGLDNNSMEGVGIEDSEKGI
jgi:hypothetical protein